MRLPSHVLTKLTLAGAIGTVGVIAALHPLQRTECKPCTEDSEATAVEVEAEPLSDAFRTPHVPSFVVTKPQPQPPKPQPIVKKPQKRMVWASVCGHSELVDEKAMLVKCGQG